MAVSTVALPLAGVWRRGRFQPCGTLPIGHKIVVMTNKRTARPARRRQRASQRGTAIAAAEFKARCLELMDRVCETREEYVITKHGKPVARLVPCDTPRRATSFVGSMRGTVLRYDRPFDPIPGEWFMDPLLDTKDR
jgi:prevent-host-death family protein